MGFCAPASGIVAVLPPGALLLCRTHKSSEAKNLVSLVLLLLRKFWMKGRRIDPGAACREEVV